MSAALTWLKPNGEWGMKGVDLAALPPEVCGALCKLMRLEHPISHTNAEYIRALDDKALAAFLIGLSINAQFCRNLQVCDDDLGNAREIPAKRCVDCMLYWLQDPHMPESSETPSV